MTIIINRSLDDLAYQSCQGNPILTSGYSRTIVIKCSLDYTWHNTNIILTFS